MPSYAPATTVDNWGVFFRRVHLFSKKIFHHFSLTDLMPIPHSVASSSLQPSLMLVPDDLDERNTRVIELLFHLLFPWFVLLRYSVFFSFSFTFFLSLLSFCLCANLVSSKDFYCHYQMMWDKLKDHTTKGYCSGHVSAPVPWPGH